MAQQNRIHIIQFRPRQWRHTPPPDPPEPYRVYVENEYIDIDYIE